MKKLIAYLLVGAAITESVYAVANAPKDFLESIGLADNEDLKYFQEKRTIRDHVTLYISAPTQAIGGLVDAAWSTVENVIGNKREQSKKDETPQ